MNENYIRNRKRSGADKARALLSPSNVVIVGASDKPGHWSSRIWRNLHRYEFQGPVFPFNPSRDDVWNSRCYRSFSELPEAPDHLMVLIPAPHIPKLLLEAAAAGASSATVIAAGFDESPDPARKALARELRAVIEETGLAVSGPNCLGNFNAAAKFFSMPDDRVQRFAPGPVAIIAQSGGIVLAIKRTLEERGLDTAALVTSGNETGLTTGDYISCFAQEPGVKVIACYLESIRDPAGFLASVRLARAAGKPVVVLKLGRTEEGRAAAAAHTGALAGSAEAFDAVAGAAGALRVKTTDDMIEVIEFLVRAGRPGRRLAGISYSGGMRGLIMDAAAAHGLSFAPLQTETRDKLTRIMTPGAVVANPLDGAFGSVGGLEPFLACVETFLADPSFDILLMQEELPRAAGTARQEKVLRRVEEAAARAGKPVAFISIASYGVTDYGRALRAELPHLTILQEPDRALRAIDLATRYLARSAQPQAAPHPPNAQGLRLIEDLVSRHGRGPLDEARSKQLLSAYGIVGPQESLAQDEEAAASAAQRIGYPVALKIVSADLPHKSESGGVALDLATPEAVRAAYRRIMAAVAALPSRPRIEGMLVAQMVTGGLELLLGVTRDHDMGLVLAFGAGGVDAELIDDVALAAIPIDRKGAQDLLERTRIGRLIAPHRGRKGRDRAALIDALLALSSLASDLGERLEAIDVNPFVLRESGGLALDGLIVLREGAADEQEA